MNKKQLELYIHIPFCTKKCDYCDFLSKTSDRVNMRQYVDALLTEIKAREKDCKGYWIRSIFIGGGTPSIIDADWIGEILEQLHSCFKIYKKAEITIEANPGTLDREKLEKYYKSGINRISLGLQSANNEELKELGRIHTYEEFLESYQLVRATGFKNINVDLMSSLPRQSIESWQQTLEKIVALKPEHISAYSLIIEAGTPFYTRYENDPEHLLPNEDHERQMYYLTRSLLKKYGYRRYEISNYAKYRKECKHNMGYWTGIQYLGFGVGAASCFGGCRFSNTRLMEHYITHATNPSLIMEDIIVLDVNAQMEEFMFLGLRLTDGVSIQEFRELFQVNLGQIYGTQLEKLMCEELIYQEEDRLKLTDYGFDISNYVLAKFLL